MPPRKTPVRGARKSPPDATPFTIWKQEWIKLGDFPSMREAGREMNRLAKQVGSWKAIPTGQDPHNEVEDDDDH